MPRESTGRPPAAPPLLFMAFTLVCLAASASAAPPGKTLLETDNPNPDRLPTLSVWQTSDGKQTFLAADFPQPTKFTCDVWCYESPLDFIDAEPLPRGGVLMRHRPHDGGSDVLTTVTPEPGAITFEARLRPGPADPAKHPGLNACWQINRAPAFASKPDPYPEFVKRCFIFTDAGMTFLHHTKRLPIPVRDADDRYNNPPWVQMYAPVWEPLPKAGPKSWADYSPDRYRYPVIGTVSRDKNFLTAIANNRPVALCQAWHDCMHNNPTWQPDPQNPGGKVWRIKIYLMPNDPEALVRRLQEDFPAGMTLHKTRVPASGDD